MKLILIFLPYFLAVTSACLRNSLIINGLINGRFTYLGHNLPKFLANFHLSPTHGISGSHSYGIPQISSQGSIGQQNYFPPSSFAGGWFPYPFAGYMNQYGDHPQVGMPVPFYPYPSLPAPTASGLLGAGDAPLDSPSSSLSDSGLVGELGVDYHNHQLQDEDHDHHEISGQTHHEFDKDLTIFSRFKGDDNEKVNSTDASVDVGNHTVEKLPEQNVNVSHDGEGHKHGGEGNAHGEHAKEEGLQKNEEGEQHQELEKEGDKHV